MNISSNIGHIVVVMLGHKETLQFVQHKLYFVMIGLRQHDVTYFALISARPQTLMIDFLMETQHGCGHSSYKSI